MWEENGFVKQGEKSLMTSKSRLVKSKCSFQDHLAHLWNSLPRDGERLWALLYLNSGLDISARQVFGLEEQD